MAASTVGKPARTRKRGDNTGPKNRSNRRIKANGHSKSDYLGPDLLLTMLNAVKNGDCTGRVPARHRGISGQLYDALNGIIEKSEMLTSELGLISEVVG